MGPPSTRARESALAGEVPVALSGAKGGTGIDRPVNEVFAFQGPLS